MSPDELSIDENIDHWHLASVFMSKVFSECKAKGVTPRTAGDEIVLSEVMEEAEKELGLYVSKDEISMMNKFPRMQLIDEMNSRRSFAYSSLMRMTSRDTKGRHI